MDQKSINCDQLYTYEVELLTFRRQRLLKIGYEWHLVRFHRLSYRPCLTKQKSFTLR